MSREFFPVGESRVPNEGSPDGEDFYESVTRPYIKEYDLVRYFGTRFEQRAKCLEGLKETVRTEILQETDKIGRLRAAYSSRKENEPYEKLLAELRAGWRRAAKANCQDQISSVSYRVRVMRHLPRACRTRREIWELSILQKVKEWDVEPHPHPTRTPGSDTSSRDSHEVFREEVDFRESCRAKRPGYGMVVPEINFVRGSSQDSFVLFSTKKHPLEKILYDDEDNPLRRLESGKSKNDLRYFHFPHNSMHRVEEAIANHYQEQPGGQYVDSKPPLYRKYASKFLCREHWTALLFEGGKYDPVHSRHMLPHCALINSVSEIDHQRAENSCNNFVIFMPYLHWEIQSNLDDLEDLLATRHHHTFPPGIRNVETKFQFLIDQAKRNWSFYYSRIDEWKHQHSKSSATCRTRSPLGEYLLHVAKFYRSFNLDADTHLLSDQLFAIPPLHPRRTLHQSYYWKRTHTGYLDRHQTTHKATDTDDYSHQGVGKVIMVDQLWMYILDENTIITFFPQRAGRNLSDSSNVHATIHSVLENVQRGHINSVHDLALLIMNECSAVFFDRGKADERPELLNIFSIALGDISESMRLTLEGFHTYVERVEHNYEDPYADLDVSSRRTLGTGHEVLLTKRLHDILDELRMMARIITQQEQVTSDYQEHLSAIHDQIRTTETHVFEEPVKSEMMEKLKDRNNASKIMTSEFTLLNVRRLARTIAKRGKELQELVTTADNLLHQLKDHVNLKQQHASIMEAQYASQVAQEGMKQNRTFLLFTIVIIIFLPLSFMSSLFGMNASDFQTSDGKNSMSLQQQLNFLFPISTVIIAISIAFAFSLRFRHPFYYMLSCLSICWSYFTAYTYIHRLSFRYPRRPIGQMTKDHQKVIKAVHKKGENAELWRRMRRDLERAESEPTKSTKR